jgi:hypothetical protein
MTAQRDEITDIRRRPVGNVQVARNGFLQEGGRTKIKNCNLILDVNWA